MGNITKKEKICMRAEPFHKYIPNLVFVEIFGLPQKTIVPAIKRFDSLFVLLDNQELTYFVRTEPKIYGKRRYPVYNVLYNRVYTRTLKEIIEKTDIEGKLKIKADEKKPKGFSKEVLKKVAERNDELIWTPVTVGTILKTRVFQELLNPFEIPLRTQIALMLCGVAFYEIFKYVFISILSRFGN